MRSKKYSEQNKDAIRRVKMKWRCKECGGLVEGYATVLSGECFFTPGAKGEVAISIRNIEHSKCVWHCEKCDAQSDSIEEVAALVEK